MIIIVPCYNEAERLPKVRFLNFLKQNPDAKVLFVNDASTDNTLTVLESIEKQYPDQISILSNTHNMGKAESVRNGVLKVIQTTVDITIAYLDADLATSLEECYSYQKYVKQGKQFVFASRILKIGSIVERKFSRFLAGRIIATFISSILDLKVYDTQCGCKVFNTEVAKIAFKNPFISKWLFDVELFSRLLKHYGKSNAMAFMEEVPVKEWIDQGESKVKLTYFFKLWIDLYKIWKSHKSTLNG
ncbi:hypothetical protein MTsPCn5_22080 [Croceitalea sp. MTPC5]|uniref:glycosyltransferase n=1 Tax=Croceitalea sp. MTPC5 TaxID=3056565 RepID=UPI002B3C1C45|nr:hypothetical protein MTsPCn5_22080 [Croceitalea sp. MTPC5]